MKYVYGPVESRRIGISLGVDPISCTEGRRICSFYCTYCQLYERGPVEYRTKRGVFVKTEDIAQELGKALSECKPEKITFSGTSEPTLAGNLGDIAAMAKEVGKGLPLAILTNSSLIRYKDVREDLQRIDEVHAKLDAPNERIFRLINRPARGISYRDVVDSLRTFSSGYGGILSLDMMFTDVNKDYAAEMAEVAGSIKPSRVIIDTPTRKCPVPKLSEEELNHITEVFGDAGINAVSFYKLEKPKSAWIDKTTTMLRRPER